MLWALSTTFSMARKVWEYGDPAKKLEVENSFLGASFMFLIRTKFQHLNAVQCIESYQRHSSLQKHLECGRHKYVLEYETLYDRAVLGYAFKLEKGPSAVPQPVDTLLVLKTESRIYWRGM